MFNKAILAAALLSVGAITAGTAASAAEIGVRNTTGFTTRDITNGRFVAVQGTKELYAELSAGVAGGYDYSESSTFDRDQTVTPVQADRASLYTTAEGPGRRPASDTRVVRPTTFERDVTSTSEYNESFRAGGSSYVRGLVGVNVSGARESYDFTGSSYNSFSELSTFSR